MSSTNKPTGQAQARERAKEIMGLLVWTGDRVNIGKSFELIAQHLALTPAQGEVPEEELIELVAAASCAHSVLVLLREETIALGHNADKVGPRLGRALAAIEARSSPQSNTSENPLKGHGE